MDEESSARDEYAVSVTRSESSDGAARTVVDQPIVTRLGPRGRAARLAATYAVLVALFAGTFWGDDDHFPVGPFRMYSISNKVDGEIATVSFVATTGSGRTVEVRPERFGLRPAEIEGQLPRLVENPESLEGLVDSYERLNEDGEDIVVLRLIHEVHLLENGRPVDMERRVLASWSAT